MEDTLDSGLRDMLDTSNSFTNNMETVEEEIKRMRESLVELDFKSEKAVVVESLTDNSHQPAVLMLGSFYKRGWVEIKVERLGRAGT